MIIRFGGGGIERSGCGLSMYKKWTPHPCALVVEPRMGLGREIERSGCGLPMYEKWTPPDHHNPLINSPQVFSVKNGCMVNLAVKSIWMGANLVVRCTSERGPVVVDHQVGPHKWIEYHFILPSKPFTFFFF